MDVLADGYSGWSPYNFVLGNPINLIDPNGQFVVPPADYYDVNGNYLGNDKNSDDKRNFVVEDKNEAKNIKQTNKKGGTTTRADVNSAIQLSSNSVLEESLNVLQRTKDNGGLREEVLIVMKDGTVVEGETGPEPSIENDVQTAQAKLPDLPVGTTHDDAEVFIHSHPTEIQVIDGKAYPQSANIPSGGDRLNFTQFHTNVIVGPLGKLSTVNIGPDGKVSNPPRPNGAVFYNSKTQRRNQLTSGAMRKILKNERKRGE